MRPCNFLRPFRIALFTNRDYFLPLPPRAGITANASAVDIWNWKTRKELGKKPGKYCESDVVVNRLLRRASPLISGEAGVAIGLRHSHLRLGCERIRVESRWIRRHLTRLVPERQISSFVTLFRVS